MSAKPQRLVWIIFTEKDFYPHLPNPKSRPEDFAAKDPRVIRIETADGEAIWPRTLH